MLQLSQIVCFTFGILILTTSYKRVIIDAANLDSHFVHVKVIYMKLVDTRLSLMFNRVAFNFYFACLDTYQL